MKWHIPVYTREQYIDDAGFHGTHRDVQPVMDTEQEENEGDPNPCPEDDDDFIRPDAEGTEEAISKFWDGKEEQEHGGFKQMHTFLSKLPVPVHSKCRAMTHAVTIEGQFLPDMSEDEQKRFTPSGLILYKHALDYKQTAEKLKIFIAMLHNLDFNFNEVDPDLHV